MYCLVCTAIKPDPPPYNSQDKGINNNMIQHRGKFWRELNMVNWHLKLNKNNHKIHHFEPLCACSMVRGHKFVKLKSANHQNLAIHQIILLPPKFPAIQ